MYTLSGSLTASVLNTAFITMEQAGTEQAATAPQLAAILTEISTDPAGLGYKNSGGAYKSANQISTLFNCGGYVPNPVAQANVALTTIPKQTLVDALEQIVFQLAEAASPKLAAYQALLTSVEANTEDPIPAAQVSSYTTQALSDQVITQTEINTLTTQLDPTWQATVFVASASPRVFPNENLFAAPDDITAALAS